MNENTRKKVLLAVFACVIIWGIYNLYPQKTDKETNKTSNNKTIAVLTKSPVKNTNLIDIEQKDKESWGRDPFIYPYKKKSISPALPKKNKLWKLTGIIYNNSTPIAVINKKPVKIGDSIDDALVIQINRKDVVIEINGSKIVLNVSKG